VDSEINYIFIISIAVKTTGGMVVLKKIGCFQYLYRLDWNVMFATLLEDECEQYVYDFESVVQQI